MTQKLSIEYVRNESQKRGYNCISKGYKNAITKLEFVCSKGHLFKSSWNSIQH